MDLNGTPFFALLRTRLDTLSQRQRLIAENVANASTPGYQPRDLDTSGFDRMLADAANAGSQLSMRRTNARHMGPSGSTDIKVIERPDSETTMDGNAVVLEEQMMRAADNRINYETGVALYQKGLQLLRLAAKPPGR
jgi:flagellar basal-body rod protein FlgB